MSQWSFTPEQARVLAALVEKAVTTPAYYPMTVNGLMAACNQKNARHPVMKLNEAQVAHTLSDLAERRLVERDDNAGRVPKWRHRFGHELLVQPPVLAVLVSLMLRGPQTLAELRSNASGLKGPQDAEGVRAALERLADRAEPLVRELPRTPGQSAPRWAHLLCGEPDLSEVPAPRSARSGSVDPDALTDLTERVEVLERELAALREALGLTAAPEAANPGDDRRDDA